MMRGIKFRAWCKTNKRFTPINYIVFNDDGSINEISTHYYEHGDDDQDMDLDSVILMQYTGLKDKNGKEIYEGDALRIWIEGYEQSTPYIVEDMRELYFELERDDSYYRIQATEITGNIYENPELIAEQYD